MELHGNGAGNPLRFGELHALFLSLALLLSRSLPRSLLLSLSRAHSLSLWKPIAILWPPSLPPSRSPSSHNHAPTYTHTHTPTYPPRADNQPHQPHQLPPHLQRPRLPEGLCHLAPSQAISGRPLHRPPICSQVLSSTIPCHSITITPPTTANTLCLFSASDGALFSSVTVHQNTELAHVFWP